MSSDPAFRPFSTLLYRSPGTQLGLPNFKLRTINTTLPPLPRQGGRKGGLVSTYSRAQVPNLRPMAKCPVTRAPRLVPRVSNWDSKTFDHVLGLHIDDLPSPDQRVLLPACNKCTASGLFGLSSHQRARRCPARILDSSNFLVICIPSIRPWGHQYHQSFSTSA